MKVNIMCVFNRVTESKHEQLWQSVEVNISSVHVSHLSCSLVSCVL